MYERVSVSTQGDQVTGDSRVRVLVLVVLFCVSGCDHKVVQSSRACEGELIVQSPAITPEPILRGTIVNRTKYC